MRIQHAVFGEQNNGHALLRSSDDSTLASKLTVLTDRPGDPPAGVDWGPIVSGFAFDDHYVLMRMLPDPTARRAGMVRTHAAYIPLTRLGELNNLPRLISELPTTLEPLPTQLQELDILDADLTRSLDSQHASGRFSLARLLSAPETKLPVLWSSSKPYLPTIAVLWAQLTSHLRASFSFQFLFAPEHYTVVVPTLAITLPELAARWPSAAIVNPEEQEPYRPTTAQSWLAGSADGMVFGRTLLNYAIELPEFARLNLFASFVDMVANIPDLSFAEARKAVNIVAKFSRVTDVSKPHRGELFGHLCELTKAVPAEDLLKLRNLENELLPDLIPDLQLAMQTSVATRGLHGRLTATDFEVLVASVAEPHHWWSRPFIAWLHNVAADAVSDGGRLFFKLAESATFLDAMMPRLPTTRATEDQVLKHLPDKLSTSLAANLCALAVRNSWIRLHAACVARSLPPTEAVISHVEVAGVSDAGLTVLEPLLGFEVLAQAACTSGAPLLVAFVGRAIGRNLSTYLPLLPPIGPHGARVLQRALSTSVGPLPDNLRQRILSVLEADSPIDASVVDLSLACVSRDPSVLVDLSHPNEFVQRLPDDARQRLNELFEQWLRAELEQGHAITIRNVTSFQDWLGSLPIVEWLGHVAVKNAVAAGVNAFRSLSFLTDAHCRQWLIDLFTRTQHEGLDTESARMLANFLGTVHFPHSAQIVRETAINFSRRDITPIHDAIRYKYQMANTYQDDTTSESDPHTLGTVLIMTALPLEREAVISHLPASTYDPDLLLDRATWPPEAPRYVIYVATTGPGNLTVQGAAHRILKSGIRPHLSFFLGVCGGVKDSDIGDVVYSTKVYSYEGAKEENDGLKARPMLKETSEKLVQLAHRVAARPWQPPKEADASHTPKASQAVFAAGEILFASTGKKATNYQHLKRSYNDTQVVDQEAFGFLKAMQGDGIELAMVVRGVSDKIVKKEESDARGNQPLAARNAAAFLFQLLASYRSPSGKKPRKKGGLISRLLGAS